MNSEQTRSVGIVAIVTTVAGVSVAGAAFPVVRLVAGVAVVGIIAYAVKEILTRG